MIRRHKTTIFTDAKESTTVYELKRIVEGILKRAPEEQRLFKVYAGISLQLCRLYWKERGMTWLYFKVCLINVQSMI